MGASWVFYGLGSETEDLPAFCVAVSTNGGGGQPLYDRQQLGQRLPLPSRYQGVKFRPSAGDPVLYLSNPAGFSEKSRRLFLDALGKRRTTPRQMNSAIRETNSRVSQYELAFRMQTSVPDLTGHLEGTGKHVQSLRPEVAKKPGTFAANCLLARRIAERGCDSSAFIPSRLGSSRRTPRQPSEALQRCGSGLRGAGDSSETAGMLDDTLVVWGGEFGRTVLIARGVSPATDYGLTTITDDLLHGLDGPEAAMRPGLTYGETGDYGYNVTRKIPYMRTICRQRFCIASASIICA